MDPILQCLLCGVEYRPAYVCSGSTTAAHRTPLAGSYALIVVAIALQIAVRRS